MVEQQPHPNPLHYPGDSYDAHTQRLQWQAKFRGAQQQVEHQNPTSRLGSEELSFSSRFGVPLEDYRAIAQGLFGNGVDTDNLTEEQNAKIEAVHRGFHRGVEMAFDEFFKDREPNE